MRKAKVFLDTNVLLKSFVIYRKYQDQLENNFNNFPKYLTDSDTKKYTFEKCIFEAYMAFRGIGGKKPDEGRGDWANRFLKEDTDPYQLSKLVSKYHKDCNGYAYHWLNNIDSSSIDNMKQYSNLIKDKDKEEFNEYVENINALKIQQQRYLNLCDDFRSMIEKFDIKTLAYFQIFGATQRTEEFNDNLINSDLIYTMDSFVRSSAIPSEDFEIIISAEIIGADIFITDDKRLLTCSLSLDYNSFLTPSAFCSSEEYEEKKKQYDEQCMFAKLDR